MRSLLLSSGLGLLVAGAAHAAKPDPAVYPNANFYREPGSLQVPGGPAKLVREHCPGLGRGLIHFFGVDGTPIRIRGTWPTYLELAPGQRSVQMEFIGTGSGIFRQWRGQQALMAGLEAGKSYVVRYRRTATDVVAIWVEPLEGVDSVGVSTSVCFQPEYPDQRLHH